MKTPINMAALEDIMQLAKKNAANAATNATSNNNSDDDIISPRVREFMTRLEDKVQIIDADEDNLNITFKLICKSDDPDVINLKIIARILDDDIEYHLVTNGCIYNLIEAQMSPMNGISTLARCANSIGVKYINRAFEAIRDRSQEYDRNKTHDEYIH